MDALQALKNTLLFRDVPESILQLMAECAEERVITGGAPIISSHQTGGSLYIIRRGAVQATRGSGEATSIVLGPGQSFGLMSLFDGGPMGLTALALEPTELLVLHAAKLREKLEGNHEAGHILFRAVAMAMAARLRLAVDGFDLNTEGSGRAKK